MKKLFTTMVNPHDLMHAALHQQLTELLIQDYALKNVGLPQIETGLDHDQMVAANARLNQSAYAMALKPVFTQILSAQQEAHTQLNTKAFLALEDELDVHRQVITENIQHCQVQAIRKSTQDLLEQRMKQLLVIDPTHEAELHQILESSIKTASDLETWADAMNAKQGFEQAVESLRTSKQTNAQSNPPTEPEPIAAMETDTSVLSEEELQEIHDALFADLGITVPFKNYSDDEFTALFEAEYGPSTAKEIPSDEALLARLNALRNNDEAELNDASIEKVLTTFPAAPTSKPTAEANKHQTKNSPTPSLEELAAHLHTLSDSPIPSLEELEARLHTLSDQAPATKKPIEHNQLQAPSSVTTKQPQQSILRRFLNWFSNNKANIATPETVIKLTNNDLETAFEESTRTKTELTDDFFNSPDEIFSAADEISLTDLELGDDDEQLQMAWDNFLSNQPLETRAITPENNKVFALFDEITRKDHKLDDKNDEQLQKAWDNLLGNQPLQTPAVTADTAKVFALFDELDQTPKVDEKAILSTLEELSPPSKLPFRASKTEDTIGSPEKKTIATNNSDQTSRKAAKTNKPLLKSIGGLEPVEGQTDIGQAPSTRQQSIESALTDKKNTKRNQNTAPQQPAKEASDKNKARQSPADHKRYPATQDQPASLEELMADITGLEQEPFIANPAPGSSALGTRAQDQTAPRFHVSNRHAPRLPNAVWRNIVSSAAAKVNFQVLPETSQRIDLLDSQGEALSVSGNSQQFTTTGQIHSQILLIMAISQTNHRDYTITINSKGNGAKDLQAFTELCENGIKVNVNAMTVNRMRAIDPQLVDQLCQVQTQLHAQPRPEPRNRGNGPGFFDANQARQCGYADRLNTDGNEADWRHHQGPKVF